MALVSSGGWPAQLGFLLLALAWLVTLALAMRAIIARRVQVHRQWMVCSYALTLAAVALRLQMPLFLGLLGLEFHIAYPIIAWACWVPNLMFAQWWLRRHPVG